VRGHFSNEGDGRAPVVRIVMWTCTGPRLSAKSSGRTPASAQEEIERTDGGARLSKKRNGRTKVRGLVTISTKSKGRERGKRSSQLRK
jgi:hypothetical protein